MAAGRRLDPSLSCATWANGRSAASTCFWFQIIISLNPLKGTGYVGWVWGTPLRRVSVVWQQVRERLGSRCRRLELRQDRLQLADARAQWEPVAVHDLAQRLHQHCTLPRG